MGSGAPRFPFFGKGGAKNRREILLTKSCCEVIGKTEAGISGIDIGKIALRLRAILFFEDGTERILVDNGIYASRTVCDRLLQME
jgi:hypothetical protein